MMYGTCLFVWCCVEKNAVCCGAPSTVSRRRTALPNPPRVPLSAEPTAGLSSVGGGGGEIAGTLEQVVGQLDILAQTVALLEQRLSLSEDRNARLESQLKQALGAA